MLSKKKLRRQEINLRVFSLFLLVFISESSVFKNFNNILTEGKKPEKLLKGSCLLIGRTNKVRLFSLSVQERNTPPYCPRDQESSPRLEVMNEAWETGRKKKEKSCCKQKKLVYI